MPRTTMSVLILFAATSLGWITSGCGRSSRDLSDEQWLTLQSDMQQERAEVGQQRDRLEEDRREWNEHERSDPIIASVISSAVLLLCCCLPLVLIALLIWPRQPEPSSEVVSDLLIENVVSEADHKVNETKRLNANNQRNLESKDRPPKV